MKRYTILDDEMEWEIYSTDSLTEAREIVHESNGNEGTEYWIYDNVDRCSIL